MDTNATITALESKTFWASLLGLGAMVATLLGQSQLASFFSSPDTLTQVLAGVGSVLFIATGVGRIVAKRKISGIVSPGAAARAVPPLLAIAAIGMGLSACVDPLTTIDAAFGIVTGASVSPQAASVAENTFDTLEASAVVYFKLPLCATGGPVTCHTQAAVNKIAPYIRTGRAARDQIQAALKANNGEAIPVASYNTLQAVVSSLQSAYTEFNIH